MLILINATMKDRCAIRGMQRRGLYRHRRHRQSGAPDYFLVFGALSLFGWVGGARIIRSQILALRETEFIMAARCLGASTQRILFRHLLPNVSNIIIVSLSLGLAGIAGSEIILTWFGVGIQPPQPSFGAMIFEAGGVRSSTLIPISYFPRRRRNGPLLRLQPPRRRPDRRLHAQGPIIGPGREGTGVGGMKEA